MKVIGDAQMVAMLVLVNNLFSCFLQLLYILFLLDPIALQIYMHMVILDLGHGTASVFVDINASRKLWCLIAYATDARTGSFNYARANIVYLFTF